MVNRSLVCFSCTTLETTEFLRSLLGTWSSIVSVEYRLLNGRSTKDVALIPRKTTNSVQVFPVPDQTSTCKYCQDKSGSLPLQLEKIQTRNADVLMGGALYRQMHAYTRFFGKVKVRPVSRPTKANTLLHIPETASKTRAPLLSVGTTPKQPIEACFPARLLWCELVNSLKWVSPLGSQGLTTHDTVFGTAAAKTLSGKGRRVKRISCRRTGCKGVSEIQWNDNTQPCTSFLLYPNTGGWYLLFNPTPWWWPVKGQWSR